MKKKYKFTTNLSPKEIAEILDQKNKSLRTFLFSSEKFYVKDNLFKISKSHLAGGLHVKSIFSGKFHEGPRSSTLLEGSFQPNIDINWKYLFKLVFFGLILLVGLGEVFFGSSIFGIIIIFTISCLFGFDFFTQDTHEEAIIKIIKELFEARELT